MLARSGFAEDSHSIDDAPASCTDRSAWLEQVRQRLPPLLQTHPLLATLSVHVAKVAAHGSDTYEGEVTSTSGALDGGARSVRGGTCAEVLDALSFIGALGLERAASQGEPAPSPISEASVPGTDSPGLDAAPPGPEPPDLESHLRTGALAFTSLQSGLTPARALALGVAVQATWMARSWQPLLSLGASSSLPEQRRLEGGGRARFEHWSAHALACPWRLPASGVWGLRPCLELDVGRIRGEGEDLTRATRRSAPWLSGAAQLRGELVLWERLELGASLAAVVPFWRAHFLVLPDERAFDTPAFGLRATSYAGLIF
jgi:hypothetical protein